MFTLRAPPFSSFTLPMMNKPSPETPAAAALVPKPRPPEATVIVVALAIVATNIFSPVRAFLITSPAVKMYAELEPAPETVIVTAPDAAYPAPDVLAYLPP